MTYSKKDQPPKGKAWLLGLGLDKDEDEDAPLRITRGENYRLLGGSKGTHEKMQEVSVRVNEDLKTRGKSLEEAEPHEIKDIVRRAAEKSKD